MTGDLPRHELLSQGRAVLDWIAEYLDHPERYPVLSEMKPGEVLASLPSMPPTRGEPLEEILEDFRTKIVPGLTHWNHPSCFAYFATSSSVPGILAEMLTATIEVKAMLWKTSPAATELEQLVTDWLRQMLGLDDGWFGMTTDTASMSSMLALAAARASIVEIDAVSVVIPNQLGSRPSICRSQSTTTSSSSVAAGDVFQSITFTSTAALSISATMPGTDDDGAKYPKNDG